MVEHALAKAQAKGWMRPPSEIATDATAVYDRKLKSHTYIKHQMEKLGLPTPDLDFLKEQDKINQLIKKHFSKADWADAKQRIKVLRFLLNRGFDLGAIKSVIKDVDDLDINGLVDIEVNFEES